MKIGDCVNHQKGFAFKSSLYQPTGRPIARVSDFTSDSIDLRGCLFISDEDAIEFKNYELMEGDVVITTVGSWPSNPASVVAKVVRVPKKAQHSLLNQNAVKLSPKENINQNFLFYLLRSKAFKEYIISTAQGSANQASITLKDIFKFEFEVPEINTQEKIGNILSMFDRKIELNNQTNETLESLAKATFKEWFIDFGPVKAKAEGKSPFGMDDEIATLFPSNFENTLIGTTPKGWQVGGVLDLAELISGGTPKTSEKTYWDGGVLWASAKDVSQAESQFIISTERSITEKGLNNSSTKMVPRYSTAVVARGATTGRLTIFGEDMAMNQTCYALKSKTQSPFFLNSLLTFEIPRLVNAAHGSIFDTITTETFRLSKIAIPPKKLIEKFEEIAAPCFHLILSNIRNTNSLKATRDLLLPKLISGEIELKDLNV